MIEMFSVGLNIN